MIHKPSKPEEMKKLILFLTLALAIGFSSCVEEKTRKETSNDVDLVLRGTHKLRKMGSTIESSSKEYRSLFFITRTEKSGEKITFSWLMNNGQYAFSSLPQEKFRVDFDSTIITPTIKFRWNLNSNLNPDLTQDIMDKEIIYVLITIREEDWPVDINLPMNK